MIGSLREADEAQIVSVPSPAKRGRDRVGAKPFTTNERRSLIRILEADRDVV